METFKKSLAKNPTGFENLETTHQTQNTDSLLNPKNTETLIQGAELITSALAIYLIVKGSKMFSSKDPIVRSKANRTITTGSVMLTGAAVLAGSLRYAIPDLGILMANISGLVRQKHGEKLNKVLKKIGISKENLEIILPTLLSTGIFAGLIGTGQIQTMEEGIVPAGLATLGVSYSLQTERNKVLRRTLATIGGGAIVGGGITDFIQSETVKEQIISMAYALLNIYFTVGEIRNLVRDALKKG